MHYLLNLERFKIYIKIHTKYRSYIFRSTTIVRELVLNLAKVIFILKHSAKFRRYMLFGDVAACYVQVWCVCVCCAESLYTSSCRAQGILYLYLHLYVYRTICYPGSRTD
jgi:hypothetical protein